MKERQGVYIYIYARFSAGAASGRMHVTYVGLIGPTDRPVFRVLDHSIRPSSSIEFLGRRNPDIRVEQPTLLEIELGIPRNTKFTLYR